MSSTTRWRRALRRGSTLVAGTTTLILVGASAALAFTSPGTPAPGGGQQTITWEPQREGVTGGQLGSQLCDASDEAEVGQTAGQPYLLWVLTMDGNGAITLDPNGLPTLTLGGSGSGVYHYLSASGSQVKFTTPYFQPLNSLTASVLMNITNTGNGSWGLKISHGCSGVAQAPTVTKDAAGSFVTTNTWNVVKTLDPGQDPQIGVPAGGTATAHYTVVVTNTGSSNTNIQVSGAIHISNTQGVPIPLSQPASEQLSDGTPCSLNGGQMTTIPAAGGDFPYTCSLPDGTSTTDLQGLTNTVTLTWADETLSDGTFLGHGQATATVPVPFTGTTANDCVQVTDSQATPPLSQQVCTGDSPATFHVAVNYPAPDPAGTCHVYDNTAIVSDSAGNTLDQSIAHANVCSGADLVVTKDATPSLTRTYTWSLGKAVLNGPTIETAGSATANYELTVSNTGSTDSNWVVAGTIHVHNPNQWADDITLNSLTDTIDNSADQGICTLNPGDPGLTIPHNSTVDFPYTCTYLHAPTKPDFTNTAMATWDAAAAFTNGSSASGQASDSFNGQNTVITTVDGSVSVDDPQAPHPPTAWTVSLSDLDSSGQKTLDYQVTFPNDPAGKCTTHPNEAVLTTSDTHTQIPADASVTVCVGADLSVTKTATPSFDRKYHWSIQKNADKTQLLDGGKVNYSVTASQVNPPTDTNWALTGTITVSNPNNWEPIVLTGNGLSDAVNNGNTHCTFSPTPAGTPIAELGSVTFAYSCAYDAAGPGPAAGTNTATASWDGNADFTPDSTASGSADFDFSKAAPTNVFDKTITVTDPMAPSNPLGSLTATDLPANPASGTFSYSKTFSAPSSGCQAITNTATFTGSNGATGSSSQTVNNCTLGALTIGFWSNKNGQTVINNAPSGLGAYIWSINGAAGVNGVFGDLPGGASATNAQVASYFLTVFSKATAAGAGAAMLKAQMLGTALNVFLWKQIGAPAPIGPQVVNVSAWASAFGNPSPPSMSINAMLSYAAGQWNGGNPYSSKATTSLAIGAFTAVNQSQVTGP